MYLFIVLDFNLVETLTLNCITFYVGCNKQH